MLGTLIEKKKFKVERIVWYSKETKWGVLATTPLDEIGDIKHDLLNNYGNISIAGNFEGAYEGAEILVTAEVAEGRYGKQLNLKTFQILQDTKTREGIVDFLSKSSIKGISTQNALKIYNTYGDKAIETVLNTPEVLIKISGIGQKTVNKVKASVEQYKARQPLYEYCSNLGLPFTLATKIADELGEEALEIIKTDPYKILDLTSTITFKQVDDIYIKSGGDRRSLKRLETGLLYTLKNLAMLEGSTGCKSMNLKTKFYKLLELAGENSEYESTVHKLSQENKVVLSEGAITGIQSGIVYYKPYLELEKSISEKIKMLNLFGIRSKEIKPEVVEEEINDFPFTLNKGQIEAVHKCLEGNVSVLTGAAGCLTGDTIIRYNRASLGRKATIERLYRAHNGLPIKYSKGWDKSIPTNVRSYIKDKNQIMLNEVETIVYSGKKEVYELKLEDGKSLKATADHRIMTKNGLVKLSLLNKGDLVMVDNIKGKKKKKVSEAKHKQRMDKRFNVGPYHPYASHRVSRDTYWVQKYRAVYESHINGVTLDEYREETKKKNNTLTYTNPKEYHIHHKDGNHHNNIFENLELISSKEHLKIHGDYNYFGYGFPEFSPVESITYVGIEDTYDIGCFKDHNFNANDIIVSNSGKSSITKVLYNVFKRSGYDVVLLSPTAKACRRLEECVGAPAQTIHKFLGMQADGKFHCNANYENTVLVIDEASMLDIILFNNLLVGTTLSSRVLLIGDNNQLPSVQAGNVLGDLVDSKNMNVSLLTDVMRQQEDSHIIKYCTMINKGEIMDPCEHEDYHYEEFGDGSELKDFFYEKYTKEVKEHGLNEVQVIAPYKKGELGMDNLNAFIQDKYNREQEPVMGVFRVGDKVRHTVNNYKKEVFNGETGTIISFDPEDTEITVDFGNKVITYDNTEAAELTLAYASTVHSSQGSEYKVVFVVLDDTSVNDFLLIRRLLYTAVSRGKKKVYVLSKPYLVDKCISNGSFRPRITKLKEYMADEN